MVASENISLQTIELAEQRLRGRYPGVEVKRGQDRKVAVYGLPMTQAATPREAADKWLGAHAAVLGVSPDHLELRDTITGDKFAVFRYRQSMDGFRVEDGVVRIVTNLKQPSRVVWVGGWPSRRPSGGIGEAQISGTRALTVAQAAPEGKGLTQWGIPRLTIVDLGKHTAGARLTWKITAREPAGGFVQAFSFFVDAARGELVGSRAEFFHATSVSGEVSGAHTPGLRPDVSNNQPSRVDLKDQLVQLYCGAVGCGDIGSTSQNNNVSLVVDLGGKWVDLTSGLIFDTPVSGTGNTIDIFFNDDFSTPNDPDTAQVNAYVAVTAAHDLYSPLIGGTPHVRQRRRYGYRLQRGLHTRCLFGRSDRVRDQRRL
jgi:hypothetical protein